MTLNHCITVLTRWMKGCFAWSLLGTCVVLLVGWSVPEVMIGDEVTHYHLVLAHGEGDGAIHRASIPAEGGGVYRKTYPHAIGWHWLGAWLTAPWSGSIRAVQAYHALYFFQALIATGLLVRRLAGDRSIIYALLLFGTMPVVVLLSFSFYLDVPLTAQVVCAACCMVYGRVGWGSVFIAAGLLIKDSAWIFAGVYAGAYALTAFGAHLSARARVKKIGYLLSMLALWWATGFGVYSGLKQERMSYYPLEAVRSIQRAIQARVNQSSDSLKPTSAHPVVPVAEQPPKGAENYTVAMFHHPGNVRDVANLFIFGGMFFWLGLGCAVVRWRRLTASDKQILFAGLCSAGVVLVMTWPACDFRYVLPCVALMVIGVAGVVRQEMDRLPQWTRTCIVAACLLQGLLVLGVAVSLRHVPSGIRDAMEVLKTHAEPRDKVFMYPEGHARLFPVAHVWYVPGGMDTFWKQTTAEQCSLLREHGVAWILIKPMYVGDRRRGIRSPVMPPSFENGLINHGFDPILRTRHAVLYRLPSHSHPMVQPPEER